MCGRFTITKPKRIVVEFEPDTVSADLGRSRYNIAPMQTVPVCALREDKRVLMDSQWGFVPHWAKEPDTGNRMINARSETAAEQPLFRTAFSRTRCLIPADGFYEWQKTDKGKLPHYVRVDDGALFAFAGLYSVWTGSPTPLVSCVILTTEPNETMRPLHHRMPVILARSAWQEWLDLTNPDTERLRSLLRPCADGRLAVSTVSRHVNSPANDDEKCVEPA